MIIREIDLLYVFLYFGKQLIINNRSFNNLVYLGCIKNTKFSTENINYIITINVTKLVKTSTIIC